MIELRLRTLKRFFISLLIVLGLVAMALTALRYRQFTRLPKPIEMVTAPAASPSLVAPVLASGSVSLQSDDPSWQVSWQASQAAVDMALLGRYPRLHERFPDGVRLILVDQPLAPEPLRGPYDDQPAELTLGSTHPEPRPGESVTPDAEAWAGCRRDLELGPARQLHCYLFVQGEPGDTLEALAVMAWVQALDETLTGRIQLFDRNHFPFLNAHKQGETWTYSDAYLSLSFLP